MKKLALKLVINTYILNHQ